MVTKPKAESGDNHKENESAHESTARLIDHVEVEIEILLGSTKLTVAELNLLKRGDVVEVDRRISEAVDIRVNERTIGRGEIVTVGDNFAVRVTQIGD